MLEETVLYLLPQLAILDAAHGLDEPNLRDRADLMRHDDAREALAQRPRRKQDFERVGRSPLALELRERQHRHGVHRGVEAIVGDDNDWTPLTALLAPHRRLQVCPEYVPATDWADVRHASARYRRRFGSPSAIAVSKTRVV